MLKWQQIFGGELERPGPDGKHRRQTITDVLRPMGGKIREALAIENGRLMHKTNVYLTLGCVGLVGAFLVFTRPGAAVQSLTGFKPVQLSMPSVASLFLPSEGAARDSAALATATSQQLDLLYAAGLTGDYSADLGALTGNRYPQSLVFRVVNAQQQDKAAIVYGFGRKQVCQEGEVACEAILKALASGSNPNDLVISQQAIDDKVAVIREKGKASLSKETCDAWAKGGFYGQHKTLKFSPFVYASALSRAEAKATMSVISTAWQKGMVDNEALKAASVSSLRELFSHRTAGSCQPMPIAAYKLDGKTSQYLVSVLVAGDNTVGASLYMAYDLNALGVKDRGFKRLKARDLANPEGIDGVESVMSLEAQGTYAAIAKELKREGMAIDASKKPDLAAQSAAIQPK